MGVQPPPLTCHPAPSYPSLLCCSCQVEGSVLHHLRCQCPLGRCQASCNGHPGSERENTRPLSGSEASSPPPSSPASDQLSAKQLSKGLGHPLGLWQLRPWVAGKGQETGLGGKTQGVDTFAATQPAGAGTVAPAANSRRRALTQRTPVGHLLCARHESRGSQEASQTQPTLLSTEEQGGGGGGR